MIIDSAPRRFVRRRRRCSGPAPPPSIRGEHRRGPGPGAGQRGPPSRGRQRAPASWTAKTTPQQPKPPLAPFTAREAGAAAAACQHLSAAGKAVGPISGRLGHPSPCRPPPPGGDVPGAGPWCWEGAEAPAGPAGRVIDSGCCLSNH